MDALLEQVGAPVGTRLEQRERITRLRILAEDDHADLRMTFAQPGGNLDPLVGTRGRHAYVGQDDVGPVSIDCFQQGLEVAARRRDLDVVGSCEELRDSLTDNQAVVGEHDSGRHDQTITGADRPGTEPVVNEWCRYDAGAGVCTVEL